ncbi:MAG: Calx-beta domain-containing protein [Desulfuromonadales bacterium]
MISAATAAPCQPNPQTEAAEATITFDVTLSNAADQVVTVDFTTVDGTAVAGEDYALNSGTLTFAPGETTQTVTVTVLDDSIYENPEAFSVLISNAQYGGSDPVTISEDTGAGLILDNDAPPPPTNPQVSIAVAADDAAGVVEGGVVNFVVTQDALSDADTTVTVRLANGSAEAGSDYTDGSDYTVTIPAGSLSADLTVDVTTIDDTIVEASPENFTANIISAVNTTGVSVGTASATGLILDNDVMQYPSGLAYTIAASKLADVNGEQLYSIDLKTGETTLIGEILVDPDGDGLGTSLGPNSTDGMELNPLDGYLYAVVNDQPNYHLIRIDPTTAATEVIDSGSEFFGVTAATFDTQGNYYLAFGNEIYTYNFDDNQLNPLAEGQNSQSFDAIAYDPIDDLMYMTVGDDLFKLNVDSGVIEPVGHIEDANEAYTVDGLAFDDNGTLWGLGNEGVIIEIDQGNASATVVTTISNSDVTGSGAHSLAVSIVDPGTYVVLTDESGSQTFYMADNADTATEPGTPIPNPFDGTPDIDGNGDDDWNLNTNLETVHFSSDGAGTVDVHQDNSTGIEHVYVQSDNEAKITVSNFNEVEVQVRGAGPSNIEVHDALTGIIDSGEGNDVITVNGGDFTIMDFDPSGDTLSFADLLDHGGTLDDLLGEITVDLVNDDADLQLTIPGHDGAANTVVTLAGLGGEYATYDGGTLNDIVNNVNPDDPTINADTYAS